MRICRKAPADTSRHALPAGDQFALFEAVVALAMLARRYDFRLDPAAPPVGMTTGATIHTSAGLHMFLTPRTPEQPVSRSAKTTSIFALSSYRQPHHVANPNLNLTSPDLLL